MGNESVLISGLMEPGLGNIGYTNGYDWLYITDHCKAIALIGWKGKSDSLYRDIQMRLLSPLFDELDED